MTISVHIYSMVRKSTRLPLIPIFGELHGIFAALNGQMRKSRSRGSRSIFMYTTEILTDAQIVVGLWDLPVLATWMIKPERLIHVMGGTCEKETYSFVSVFIPWNKGHWPMIMLLILFTCLSKVSCNTYDGWLAQLCHYIIYSFLS